MRSVSKQLNEDLDKVDKNLVDLQTRLVPVTKMNETVGMCKNNIEDVLTKIRGTFDALTTAEKATAGLKSKDMISKNTAQFALWIEKG